MNLPRGLVSARSPIFGLVGNRMPCWRFVSGGRVKALELLAITDEGSIPNIGLRHFGRKLVARRTGISNCLVAWKQGEAAFEGLGSMRASTVRNTDRRVGDHELTATPEKASSRQECRIRRKRP